MAKKPPGSLLARNAPFIVPGGGQPVEAENPTVIINDPLSSDYMPPTWLLEKPTPWYLVGYFEACLQELVLNGETRKLVHGYPPELKPAKKLLEHGIELAARTVYYTAMTVDGPVTLWRALERVDQVKELCGM